MLSYGALQNPSTPMAHTLYVDTLCVFTGDTLKALG